MIQRLGDSLTNLVGGLGTDRDQAVATTYVLTHLTDDQILRRLQDRLAA